MKRSISDEIKEAVINEYMQGELTVMQIVEKYNVSKASVYLWLSKDKLRVNTIMPAKIEIATSEYKKGNKTLKEIIEIHKLSDDTIRKYIPSKDLRKNKKKERMAEISEPVKKDYLEGKLLVREIAQKYGIHRAEVYELIKETVPSSQYRRKPKFQ